MFFTYSDKNVVWDRLEKLGKSYYIYAPEIQAMNYLETLPSVLYSYHIYSVPEQELITYLGLQFDFSEPSFIFNRVLSVVQNMILEIKVLTYKYVI